MILKRSLSCELKAVTEWMKSNTLAVSVLKTKYILFLSKKLKPCKSFNLLFDGVNIKQVPTVKYVGVTFDSNLTWKYCIDELCLQLSKGVGILCKPRYYTIIRDLKQTRRRRKQERHLKMWLRVFAIIFHLFKLIMLEKCVLTILELNWNQRLGHKKTKLNICHHMLTSSTQLQNWSFHVVERTRMSAKFQKMKNARAKRAKILFFVVKYANLWGFSCRRRRGCLSSLLINQLCFTIH